MKKRHRPPARRQEACVVACVFRLFLSEDYDTVPVVCAVRLYIAAVEADVQTIAADAVGVHEGIGNSVGTTL